MVLIIPEAVMSPDIRTLLVLVALLSAPMTVSVVPIHGTTFARQKHQQISIVSFVGAVVMTTTLMALPIAMEIAMISTIPFTQVHLRSAIISTTTAMVW